MSFISRILDGIFYRFARPEPEPDFASDDEFNDWFGANPPRYPASPNLSSTALPKGEWECTTRHPPQT